VRRGSSVVAVTLLVALLVALSAVLAPRSGTSTAPRLRLVPTARLVATGRAVNRTPCKEVTDSSLCYQPAQLRDAYNVGPLYAEGINGHGVTIVIVDAFGSPTIAKDLTTFDKAFGLAAPPSFKIITPAGKIPAYHPNATDRYGWSVETSLDVEWAHALAPGAKILLVETPTDEVEGTTGFPDIVTAENYVLKHDLGAVISQSFVATEQTFTSYAQLKPLRSAYLAAQKDHVSVVGGSGDLGATDYEDNARSIYPYRVTGWPASDPLVTAVGGTKLDLAPNGTANAPAVAWNDTPVVNPSPSATGGGLSVFFARPTYQDGVSSVTGPHRGVPDVSMSAACSGPVDIYDSAAGPGVPGWGEACGTSEATPLFAAIIALADQKAGHPLGLVNPALYALLAKGGSGVVPITSGDNTVAFKQGSSTVTVTGFDETGGYSLVTGIGTVNAALFVPALVGEVAALGAARSRSTSTAPRG
jgi:subtilase family serine protease